MNVAGHHGPGLAIAAFVVALVVLGNLSASFGAGERSGVRWHPGFRPRTGCFRTSAAERSGNRTARDTIGSSIPPTSTRLAGKRFSGRPHVPRHRHALASEAAAVERDWRVARRVDKVVVWYDPCFADEVGVAEACSGRCRLLRDCSDRRRRDRRGWCDRRIRGAVKVSGRLHDVHPRSIASSSSRLSLSRKIVVTAEVLCPARSATVQSFCGDAPLDRRSDPSVWRARRS